MSRRLVLEFRVRLFPWQEFFERLESKIQSIPHRYPGSVRYRHPCLSSSDVFIPVRFRPAPHLEPRSLSIAFRWSLRVACRLQTSFRSEHFPVSFFFSRDSSPDDRSPLGCRSSNSGNFKFRIVHNCAPTISTPRRP